MLGDLVATFSVVQFKNWVLDHLSFIYKSWFVRNSKDIPERNISLSPWQSLITGSETERCDGARARRNNNFELERRASLITSSHFSVRDAACIGTARPGVDELG